MNTEKQLARTLAALRRWETKIKTLRMKLGNKCTHSVVDDYPWKHEQTLHVGKRCRLCNLIQFYPSMSSVWVEL